MSINRVRQVRYVLAVAIKMAYLAHHRSLHVGCLPAWNTEHQLEYTVVVTVELQG